MTSQNNDSLAKNQILLTFKDEATADYVRLVSSRKGYDLENYILGNFEWDDRFPCLEKIDPKDCKICDFFESCPDHIVRRS